MSGRQLVLLCWCALVRQTWTQSSCTLEELETGGKIQPHYPKLTEEKDSYEDGEIVPYECAPGYRHTSRLPRYRNATCRGGHWDYPQDSLVCSAVNCGHPGDVQHARLDSSVFTFPNKVMYNCDRCYSLVAKGTHILFCQSDGKWSPDRRPACQLVKCPEPSTVGNGMRRGDDFTCGSTVTYVCNKDYTLRGTDTLECDGDGKWSPEYPVCEFTPRVTATTTTTEKPNATPAPKEEVSSECDKLQAPNNGQVEISGSLAKFACNDGYVLNGSSTLKCLPGSTWNTTERPTCGEKAKADGPGVAPRTLVIAISVALVVLTVCTGVGLWCRRRLTRRQNEVKTCRALETHTDSEVEHLQNPCPMTSL